MAQHQHQHPEAAVSRTTQYKKVTKPLLERKRRARINRCLDELKELMVGALEAEGENVSKLEKADILELTVRHLQRLARPGDSSCWQSSRFQAGFKQCASEACQFLLTLPGLDARLSRRLVAHLGTCVDAAAATTSAASSTTSSPPSSPCPASSSEPTGPLSVQVPPPARRGFSPPVSPCSLARAPPLGVALSSTPSAQDLAKPMAGLLMTVPSSQSGMWRPW